MPATFRAASITAICMPRQMPEVGHAAFAREGCGGLDLAFGPALAKAAGHQNGVKAFKMGRRVLCRKARHRPIRFADLDPVGHAAMGQRLGDGFIGIFQLGVFAHNGHADFAFGVVTRSDTSSQTARLGRGPG